MIFLSLMIFFLIGVVFGTLVMRGHYRMLGDEGATWRELWRVLTAGWRWNLQPSLPVPLQGEAFHANVRKIFGGDIQVIKDKAFQERFPCAGCGARNWRWRYGNSPGLPHPNSCSECEPSGVPLV
jgi:hypothetical protein